MQATLGLLGRVGIILVHCSPKMHVYLIFSSWFWWIDIWSIVIASLSVSKLWNQNLVSLFSIRAGPIHSDFFSFKTLYKTNKNVKTIFNVKEKLLVSFTENLIIEIYFLRHYFLSVFHLYRISSVALRNPHWCNAQHMRSNHQGIKREDAVWDLSFLPDEMDSFYEQDWKF